MNQKYNLKFQIMDLNIKKPNEWVIENKNDELPWEVEKIEELIRESVDWITIKAKEKTKEKEKVIEIYEESNISTGTEIWNDLMENLSKEISITKIMVAYLILILIIFGLLWYYVGYWILDKF